MLRESKNKKCQQISIYINAEITKAGLAYLFIPQMQTTFAQALCLFSSAYLWPDLSQLKLIVTLDPAPLTRAKHMGAEHFFQFSHRPIHVQLIVKKGTYSTLRFRYLRALKYQRKEYEIA